MAKILYVLDHTGAYPEFRKATRQEIEEAAIALLGDNQENLMELLKQAFSASQDLTDVLQELIELDQRLD